MDYQRQGIQIDITFKEHRSYENFRIQLKRYNCMDYHNLSIHPLG